MDYEDTIYFIAPSEHFHPLGLLKINTWGKNNSNIFLAIFNSFLNVFHINK
jgi:hypothetical protein